MTSLLSRTFPGIGTGNRCCVYLVLGSLAILSAQHLSGQTSRKKDQIVQAAEQAKTYLQNGKPDLAIVEYQKIIALEPKDVDAQANIGVAYYMEQSFQEAARHLGVALSEKPDLWNIEALLGMSEKQLGQNTAAQAHLEAAFAHVQERDLHTAVGKQLFVLYIQAGKLVPAASVAGQLQQENPSDADILYAAHQVYSELAGTTLYSIALLQPDSARMYQAKGDQLAQQGNTAAAIAAYRQALQRDPHLPGAHYELAEIMNVSTSPAERAQAEAEYKAALSDNPLDEKAESGLAAVELQQSDFQMAAQYYAQAVRLQPDDPAANEGLGRSLMSLDQLKEAKPYLEHAVELDPTKGSAHYRLGLLDRRLGDPVAAKREMDEFVKLREGQEKIEQTLKDMHVQLVTQIQRDRNVEASEGSVSK
jgi:tetratricopeptide (TPR) repeat protein